MELESFTNLDGVSNKEEIERYFTCNPHHRLEGGFIGSRFYLDKIHCTPTTFRGVEHSPFYFPDHVARELMEHYDIEFIH